MGDIYFSRGKRLTPDKGYRAEGSFESGVWDGRLVAAGRYQVGWDGRDQGGRLVPPGLYLVRVEIAADVADVWVGVVY